MKFVFLAALLTVNAGAALSQQSGTEAGSQLAVLKYSWARERVAWEGSDVMTPGGVPNRPVTRKPRTDAYRKKESSEQRSARLASTGTPEQAEDPRFSFTYEVVVRNDSAKKVREIDWDYVFLAVGTEEELGRRQFTSEDSVAAGKTKKISIRVATPPAYSIRAQQTGKNESAAFTERIYIARILYDDGTEWKAN